MKRFAKKKENSIVRFVVKEREIGRLAGEPAAFVSKLLDLGIAVLSGCVLDLPDTLKLMDNITMSLEIRLSRHGKSSLCSPPVMAVSINLFSARTLPAFDYRPLDDEVQKQRISALQAALDKIGKVPLQKSHHQELLEERKKAKVAQKAQTAPQPPLSPAAGASTFPPKEPPFPLSSSSKDPPNGAVQDEEEDEDESREGSPAKKAAGEEQQEGQIDDLELEELYRTAASIESELTETEQPSTLIYQLRPYQKQALTWMVHREQIATGSKGLVLHPLWEEHIFDPQSQGSLLYLPPIAFLHLQHFVLFDRAILLESLLRGAPP